MVCWLALSLPSACFKVAIWMVRLASRTSLKIFARDPLLASRVCNTAREAPGGGSQCRFANDSRRRPGG